MDAGYILSGFRRMPSESGDVVGLSGGDRPRDGKAVSELQAYVKPQISPEKAPPPLPSLPFLPLPPHPPFMTPAVEKNMSLGSESPPSPPKLGAWVWSGRDPRLCGSRTQGFVAPGSTAAPELQPVPFGFLGQVLLYCLGWP